MFEKFKYRYEESDFTLYDFYILKIGLCKRYRNMDIYFGVPVGKDHRGRIYVTKEIFFRNGKLPILHIGITIGLFYVRVKFCYKW